MPAADAPIVIVYLLAGIGHKRAAEAIGAAARAAGHTAVHVVDILDYMPAWFRWLCPRLYLLCINRLPWLWAAGFWLTDNRCFEWLTGGARRVSNRWMARRWLRWLVELQPAVVICAHFLPGEVLASWPGRHRLRCAVWNMVTDYHPHIWWSARGVDRYFVGLPETAAELQRRGAEAARITISGIPVDAAFERQPDAAAIRRRQGFAEDKLTLLITSGGFGLEAVARLCASLTRLPAATAARMQCLVVAGNNPRLQARLERLMATGRMACRVMGYTQEMHDFMAAADVVITKPGGMTVTEALVTGRPLVLFAPIWGQETGNAALLVQHGVAHLLETPEACGPLIAQWADDRRALETMRSRTAALSGMRASRVIVEALRA